MDQVKILIVEDSKMFANVIGNEIRSRLGFSCTIVSSLGAAKETLEKDPDGFFMAVVDLSLPDARDEEIVDFTVSKGISSIVFTGNFNDDIRERILGREVVDYVLKEGIQDVDYLVRAIHRVYRNQFVKVLVVDDSSVTRAHLKNLLSLQKLVILEASSGKEGLEIIKSNPDIRLVITDYNMPEMDGFQFVSAIRKKYSSDRMAIIGISAHGSGVLSAKFLKKGANDFVNKPFAKEELYCRVNQNLEMLEYIDAIHDASNKDYLTELYNRRYFFDVGRKIFENAKRGNLEITVALVDIDHFKKVNDTYGHDAGDMALKFVANIIQKNMRKSDMVARYGGEEFCVLAANMNKDKTREFFEEMRESISGSKIIINPAPDSPDSTPLELKLTVSIGVSTKLSTSLEATINYADENLYKAKESGRNRVVVDGE